MRRPIKYIIGIDEVGRGSLAGPVTVAALALPILSSPRLSSPRLSSPRKRGSKNIVIPSVAIPSVVIPSVVIPAKAGIQKIIYTTLDSRLRGNDTDLDSRLRGNDADLDSRLRGNDNKLRDSKKLSPKQRQEWFQFIKQQKIPYAVASVSPKIIDKINISQAANLAATKALMKLMKTSQLKAHNSCQIFLDGGLFLRKPIILSSSRLSSPRKRGSKNIVIPSVVIPSVVIPAKAGIQKIIYTTLDSRLRGNDTDLDSRLRGNDINSKNFFSRAKTVIRGDEKIPAISLASIVAKVYRDKLMKRLHKKYSRYDFCNNVGYGTSKHIKAIKKFGRSKIHRESFVKKISNKSFPLVK